MEEFVGQLSPSEVINQSYNDKMTVSTQHLE